MAEHAKSRGFYPLMAIPLEATSSFSGGGGKSFGKGKGKGKRGKSKGKKGKVNRPFPKGLFGSGKGKQSSLLLFLRSLLPVDLRSNMVRGSRE